LPGTNTLAYYKNFKIRTKKLYNIGPGGNEREKKHYKGSFENHPYFLNLIFKLIFGPGSLG
jgi:hypothetical protein